MTAPNRPFWRRLAQAAAASKTSASAVQNTAPAGAGSAMRPLALEQRFMFDGAGAADAAHAVADGATGSDAGADTASALRHALMAEAAPTSSPRQEVVFVDSQVPNLAELLAGLSSSAEVVILDASKDGLQQMADYLQGRNGLDAIHLLSHGADGTVQMGNVWLSSANLGEHSAALQSIGAALKADGDLMLYGCDVGQGDKGQAFLDQLAAITGADVAASADDTGAAALGGNWSLERSSGAIETATLSVSGYDSLMAVNYTGGDSATAPLMSAGASLSRSVVGDFNNDGRDDILFQASGVGGAWSLALGNANGTFSVVTQGNSPFSGVTLLDAATNGVNYHAADFDGDGDVDLLGFLVSGQGATLYRNNGTAFVAESIAGGPLAGVRSFAGDFNGDGSVDVLYQVSSDANAAFRVMLNNGNGTFTDVASTDSTSPFRNLALPDITLFNYKVGDIDGDGDTDLLYVFANQQIRYFRNDNGLFVDATASSNLPTPTVSRVVVGDFDGDGDMDVLYQTGGNTTAWRYARNDGGVFVDLDQASSPFSGVTLTDMTNQQYRVGDFDGDGDLDVFASTSTGGKIYFQAGSVPKLVSATPADNSLTVTPSANITLTFDQSVSKGAGNIYIVRTSDSAIIQTIDVTSSRVTGTGTTWTIDPPADMVAGESYAVRIDNKTFSNANGQVYKGIQNNTALNFTVVSVAAPVIANLNGDAVNYTEKGAAVLIDSGSKAVVTDADSVNFSGGTVRVAVTGGAATGEDVLSILSTGTAAGQISVSGSNVLYGGVLIGAFTGGSGGNALVITLNASADATAVSALVQSVQYSNSNTTTPNTGARTLSVTVSDETGTTSTAATATVNILAVNDAPVVSVTGTNPTYTEDGSAIAVFSGASINTVETVQTIIQMTLRVTNLANGALEKLVIDGSDVTLTDGTSILTLNNGLSVSVTVVAGTANLTLTHSGLSSAAAQTIINGIGYRNDSQAPTGSSRAVTLLDVRDSGTTSNGGADATAANVASIVTLVAVNDAPTLSGGPYAITSTDENTTSTAVAVSTVLAGANYADVDAGATSGIAIISTVGRGTWQYSTDGTTWTAFGTVSTSSALLLGSTTQVRYVPDNANGENVSFTYRAWDQTSGVASTNGVPNTGDTTTNGVTSAYSNGSAQATLVVSAVNDAPVIIPVNPTLTGLTDTSLSNSGNAVSSLLGGVTDVDTGALKGMAITGLTSTYGTWQYSTNVGTTWINIGAVSETSALILRSGDRLRFVPDGVHGETATITYRAWDQTGATIGQQGNRWNVTSLTGGSNPFSSATDTASVVVTAVNDAPVVTGSGGSVGWTEGNNVVSTPVVIDNLLVIVDPDGPGIVSATVTLGVTYVLGEDTLGFTRVPATMGDIIGSWDAVQGVLTLTSAGGATQAQFEAALRSVTYTNDSDRPTTTTRTVSFKVNDSSLDSNVVTRDVTITAVNDAPLISAPTNVTVTEDILSPVTGIILSDVDSSSGTLTLTVGAGNLSGTSGSGVTVAGTGSALTLSGTLTAINNFIAAGSLKYTPTADSTTSVTLGLSLDTTSVSTTQRDVTLDITAVNDAPTISAPPSIGVTEDVAKSMADITFADVDASIGSVTVIFSVASGNGTFTGAASSGVTISNSGTNAITLEGTVADINDMVSNGRLTYLGALNAVGLKTMTVSINDNGNTGSGGSLTDNATVSLVIAAVNDAPVNNLPSAQTVFQDGSLVFNSANGNLITITDVDAGGNSVKLSLTSVNGQMTLGSLIGLSFITGDGTNDTTMAFSGTLAAINAALNGLIFTPQAGYNGAGSITFESDDQGFSGAGGVKTDVDVLSITIAPVNPKITGVVAVPGSDGAHKVGDTIDIVVNFDNAVIVDQNSGSPTLLLETGANDQRAVYLSGTGTNQLTFRYTVLAGDVSGDLDYASTAALELNGAVLQSPQGYTAILTLPTVGGASSLAGQQAIVIDGVAPSINNIVLPGDAAYHLGQNLDFTVNFSEAVSVSTGGGIPRIEVTLDTGGTAYAEYVSGSGSSALVFRLVVASGQLDSNGITVGNSIQLNGGSLHDLAGNDSATALTPGNSSGILVDGVVPTVASVSVPANGAYKAGDVLSFTVNASKAVFASGSPRLALDIGGTTRYATLVAGSSSGSTLVFQYTVQVGDSDSDGISVASNLDLNGGSVKDAAGNDLNLALNNADDTAAVLVDTTLPYATNIVLAGTTPTNSASVSYTVTFSEVVSNVDASDFSMIFSGTANGSIENISTVDGRVYTVTVGNLSGAGRVRLDVRPGTNIADAAGNLVPGGRVGVNYSIDRVAPSVTSVDVPAGGTYVVGQNLDFTVHLDEAVQLNTVGGTPRIAVTLDTGGTVYAEYVSGSGTSALVFRMVVTSGQLDSNGITLGGGIDLNGGIIIDGVGNTAVATLNGVASTAGVHVDGVLPTVVSVVAPVDGSYKAGDVLTFTVNASEAVQIGSLAPRLALDVGGVTRYATYISGSGSDTLVFQYVVQNGDNDANGIAVNSLDLRGEQLTDLAGNDLDPALNGVGNTSGVLVDNVAPTASLSLDKTSLNAQETAQLTIRFSEAVTGLDVGDFTVTDGTLSDLVSTDGGITWTATLTPAAGKVQSHLQVVLNHTGYTDLAGNAAASDSLSGSYAIDTVLPAQPVLEVESNVEGNATVRVDALEAGAQWEYSLDAGQTWQAGQGNVVAIASPGQYLLQVRQTNAVGNRSEVAALTVDVAPLAVPPTVEWPLAGVFGNAGVWEIVLPSAGGVPFGSVATEPVAPRTSGAFLGNDGAPSGALATSPFFNADVATDRSELSLGFLGFAPSRSGEVPGAPAALGVDAGSGTASDRLVLLHPVDAVVADTGRQVDWKVPPTMFGHSDPLASVQFAMTQADGRPLPAWLKFDARTGQVSGTMPPGFQGELTLRLTARDSQGHAVSTTIKIKAGDTAPAARSGMAEQLQRHAQLRAGQMAAQRLHL